MTATPHPALEALWKRVLDRWDDESAHDAYLEYCQKSERLVDAAVRYRGMSGDRNRAPIAEKRLKAVALLALAGLEVVRVAERGDPRRLARYVLLAGFLLAIFGLLAYLGVTR